MSNVPFAAQMEELAAYMASKISVPTIGIGGGYAPIGTIISYMGTTAPQDYLACDGSIKNIADYPQLAEFFAAQFGSKNYFGGNGTTTFAVPDLRGEFLRGTGTNSHTNQGSGANVGVHQDATEHINFIIDGDAPVGQVGLRAMFNTDFLDQYGNMSNKKTDNFINSPTTNAKFNDFNLDSIGTSSGKGAYFTSKPTNTSILYCIKAVVAGEVYSTEEREVGTWIDGKKLYQKTVDCGAVPNNTTKTVSLNVSNVNYYFIVNAFAIADTSSYKQVLPIPYIDSGAIAAGLGALLKVESGDLKALIKCGTNYSSYTCYMTVRYTKTT